MTSIVWVSRADSAIHDSRLITTNNIIPRAL